MGIAGKNIMAFSQSVENPHPLGLLLKIRKSGGFGEGDAL